MFEAQIKTTEPMTVAYVPMHGSYDQVPEGYRRLYEWVDRHGMQPIGMPEAIYLTMPDSTVEDQALWELWAPVAPGPREAPPAKDGIGVKVLLDETVASATHTGQYDTVGTTYEALGTWIKEHGYTISGPPREVYLSDPDKVSPEETQTEIQFPVRRMV